MNQSVELGLVSTSRVRASTWCYADLLPENSHRRLLAMSADRSKRTRRLACVGLGVFKEVLVVTGCCVPFLQNKITETIPNSYIESMMRQPHIYQNWCTSNTGGCRAGSQMCASYCGCNGNLLSCCCSYGSPFWLILYWRGDGSSVELLRVLEAICLRHEHQRQIEKSPS